MDIKRQIKNSLADAYRKAPKSDDITTDMSSQLRKDLDKVKEIPEEEKEILNIFAEMANEMVEQEEMEDQPEKEEGNFDFNFTEYEPETKSIVGAYYIADDFPKQITVLNGQEVVDERSVKYTGGIEPINFYVNTVKLPKSQIEILDQVEGKDDFYFIRIPYWLFKKFGKDLQVSRVKGPKRVINFTAYNNHRYKDDILNYVNQTIDDEITLRRFESNIRPDSKKEETKEATGASSAGGYSVPLFGKPQKRKIKENNIKGGLADNMTPKDLAKRYKTTVEDVMDQLVKGIEVEMEHTSQPDIAEEIAMDHIYEDLYYYDKLAKMEGESHKEESKEATTSSSVGVYDAPIGGGRKDPLQIDTPDGVYKKLRSVQDKNFPKYGGKDGKYVKVKDKCKKFPYCNQGDINALEFFEKREVKEAIMRVSKKTGKKPNDILEIIDKLMK